MPKRIPSGLLFFSFLFRRCQVRKNSTSFLYEGPFFRIDYDLPGALQCGGDGTLPCTDCRQTDLTGMSPEGDIPWQNRFACSASGCFSSLQTTFLRRIV